MRSLLIAWACVVVLGSGRAQTAPRTAFDSIAQRGIAHVYNLEFARAEEEFHTLVRMAPGDPAGHFFLAMVLWWKISLDMDNEAYDAQFYSALDAVIDMCDSILSVRPNDVQAIFFKGGAIGFEGRLRFHRDDYLGAANAGRKALPLVQEASSLDPDNWDILLGSGIYNYYAEVIPNEYPLVKPLILFIPPGDKQKGIQQLSLAAQKGKYASIEASYFLLQIYYFYEKDYTRALAIALNLQERFPNNMLFQRYVGRIYVALNNWLLAEQVFRDILSRVSSGKPGYGPAVEREAQYYLGLGDMFSRHLDEALAHFYRCDELSRALDHNEASGFMAMANLKTGMIYDLQGKRDLAIMQYEKVISMKDYKDSRSQAEQFRKTPYTLQ
ncbi:MAG TPA: tetratricopeptide repeat protein [Bacteroidota bacterium]|nr:tetratricopeptide repeat protein [Bacteroidota bacterium]